MGKLKKVKSFKLAEDETYQAYFAKGYEPRSLVTKKKDASKMALVLEKLFKEHGIECRVEWGLAEPDALKYNAEVDRVNHNQKLLDEAEKNMTEQAKKEMVQDAVKLQRAQAKESKS